MIDSQNLQIYDDATFERVLTPSEAYIQHDLFEMLIYLNAFLLWRDRLYHIFIAISVVLEFLQVQLSNVYSALFD